MTDPPGLTAGEVARRLGVAVTTLRSWHQRYGIGPSQHRSGHHRRYSEDDLARLERMHLLTAQGVPTAEAARLVANGGPAAAARAGGGPHAIPGRRDAPRRAAVRGLAAAALRLDIIAARRLLAESVAATGVVATWDELVRPVLAGIAAKQAGPHGETPGGLVDVEHLLSRCVSEILAAVPRPETAPRILLACAEDEHHSLPLEALAAALAERGVGCRLLGARVPPAALAAAVHRTGPALVLLWSHSPETADPEQLHRLLHQRRRSWLLAVAGPGWGEDLPVGTVVLPSLTEAVELALGTVGEPAAVAGQPTGALGQA